MGGKTGAPAGSITIFDADLNSIGSWNLGPNADNSAFDPHGADVKTTASGKKVRPAALGSMLACFSWVLCCSLGPTAWCEGLPPTSEQPYEQLTQSLHLHPRAGSPHLGLREPPVHRDCQCEGSNHPLQMSTHV